MHLYSKNYYLSNVSLSVHLCAPKYVYMLGHSPPAPILPKTEATAAIGPQRD